MSDKKLCSIGILDININLVLRKEEAENYNFDINKYNKVEDLENLFFQKQNNNNENTKNESIENQQINYLDFISLSSDNNLINTLLYINRAYKTKTFIEFIMLNQMDFSYSTKFVRKFIQEVFDKNYFFIIENKILDIPSKIKFTIKILNNDDDQIISMKSFELFEINDIEVEKQLIDTKNEGLNNEDEKEESNNNLFYENKNMYIPTLNIDKINYNFGQTDYFLLDLSVIKDFKLLNNKDLTIFLFEIIKKHPKIQLILIVDDNINSVEKENLKVNKQLLELSDIIFSFQDKLNNFFQLYNSTIKKNEKELKYVYYNLNDNVDIIGNLKPRKYNLIIDDQDKCRKNIPRTTIILEEFDYVSIYKQIGIQMKVEWFETFHITANRSKNKNKIDYLNTNSEKFYHIFIAGFLSRMIYEKSFRVCVVAGDLLIKNNLPLFMNNIDYISDIDLFNVLVPSIKKSKKTKINEQIIREYEELLSKENKFVLDCTNVLKCKKKEYNPLYDLNCASYLFKDQNLKHLKNVGFINKNGIILRDPDNVRKKVKNKKKNLIKNIIRNRILTETDFFIHNNMPFGKTNYNPFNTINFFKINKYESPQTNKRPKFMSIFNPLSETSHHNVDLLSKNLKTIYNLPKMSKTYYNFSNRDTKKNYIKISDLRKSKTMLKNIYDLSKSPRNLSFNKEKNLVKNNRLFKYKKFQLNNNNLPKLHKKVSSEK